MSFPHLDAQTLQLAIVAAVAIAMLVQAIVLVVGLLIVRKSIAVMRDEIEDLSTSVRIVIHKIEPLVDSAYDLLDRTGPKIEAAANDLAAMSQNLRAQSMDVQAAAAELIERFRCQGARMDSMLTNIFSAIDRASTFVNDTVSKPMRQLAGLLASAKAVVETLREGTPAHPLHGHSAQDDRDLYQ
jgi:ABC-type transporter Mla subunit MlaD